ncbi:tumor necrosis factor ligand superfamily member 15 [Protopterus annectens]|uniref:tumor necrosis factor ligand superfamily member 15 n=1 Tax=Protopterus annectens TaxID=7888 RepID=UPI001CFBD746|nr:tumor necrosis factor ligand superfamily member 15 [Protopterus annectens]
MDSNPHMLDEEQFAFSDDTTTTTRNSGYKSEEFRRLRFAVACCMLSIFILAVVIAFLLVCNLRASDTGRVELVAVNTSEQGLSRTMQGINHTGIESLPMAHLTATKTNDYPSENWDPALEWEDKDGLAFTSGMKYHNKALEIPKDGYYFVYSQVTFRAVEEINKSISKTNSPYATQIITKIKPSYPDPIKLLKGETSIPASQQNWRQTVSLGAMFKLEEGDRLLVNVSNVSLVDYSNEYKTYFGAFLLPDLQHKHLHTES